MNPQPLDREPSALNTRPRLSPNFGVVYFTGQRKNYGNAFLQKCKNAKMQKCKKSVKINAICILPNLMR
jgi:hypothetical protein